MNKDRIYFNQSSQTTIGVEAELFTVSKKDFNLYPGAPAILNKFEDDIHVKEELLECIVEVNTGICDDIRTVRSDLTNKVEEILETANEDGIALVSIGTHPFASWTEQTVTPSPRYTKFLERMQWPVRRLIISGLHVHIGVESGEKAIAITNGMTRYIPTLIGLSANSPFFDKELTGLVSTRTKIFEGLPTAGLPPILKNYSEFQKFMRTLQKADSIQSIREYLKQGDLHQAVSLFQDLHATDQVLMLLQLEGKMRNFMFSGLTHKTAGTLLSQIDAQDAMELIRWYTTHGWSISGHPFVV